MIESAFFSFFLQYFEFGTITGIRLYIFEVWPGGGMSGLDGTRSSKFLLLLHCPLATPMRFCANDASYAANAGYRWKIANHSPTAVRVRTDSDGFSCNCLHWLCQGYITLPTGDTYTTSSWWHYVPNESLVMFEIGSHGTGVRNWWDIAGIDLQRWLSLYGLLNHTLWSLCDTTLPIRGPVHVLYHWRHRGFFKTASLVVLLHFPLPTGDTYTHPLDWWYCCALWIIGSNNWPMTTVKIKYTLGFSLPSDSIKVVFFFHFIVNC